MESPLALPLRIRRVAEAIAIEDAAGRRPVYIYTDADPARAQQRGRVSPEAGEEIARIIARALTEAAALPARPPG